MVVFSYYYQFMCAAKKSQYDYQGRCHLQEDTSSSEPYQPQSKKSEDEHSGEQSSDKQTLKADHKNFDSMNNQVQSYSRQKMDFKPS